MPNSLWHQARQPAGARNKSTAHTITRIPQGLESPSNCAPPAVGWASTAGVLVLSGTGARSTPENCGSICNSNPGKAED